MSSGPDRPFARKLGTVGSQDFNASFRGEVYGENAVDADWFADHVGRNGIDLARSPRWSVDGELAGMALLAFRGARAWLGAFGVVPALRGQGYGRRFLSDTLALAAQAGASTLELEVLEHNPAALALYEQGGFRATGRLVVWQRAPLSAAAGPAGSGARNYDAAAVARSAHAPAPCWQREPAAVAAASPLERILIGADVTPSAYAFVRRRGVRASLLDAGARDPAAAAALLAALDALAAGSEALLLNEPPHGPLHDALHAHPHWSELARQQRMIARLR